MYIIRMGYDIEPNDYDDAQNSIISTGYRYHECNSEKEVLEFFQSNIKPDCDRTPATYKSIKEYMNTYGWTIKIFKEKNYKEI